ncbi:hypothetical protein [Streptomyces qinzhouensis]|uniref:Uncharacterized protein n=1 Tax=Streptomyces qinzhouensis TaxID=2599401 RepID=A0A5B8IJX0_9ACTN|nr:hypothetical protein [Streptomyces qinzhouensis]QDY77729.1 hypothetical protein FQU76_15800 [Streptomyces qinzhouensis]
MPEPGREGRATPCEKHDTEKEGTGRGAPREDPEENTGSHSEDTEAEEARRRRRAAFLRELNEAKALRDRVRPRRARAARMRQQMRMRTFRW